MVVADKGEEAVAAFVTAKGSEAQQEAFQPCPARTFGVGRAAARAMFCVLHRVFLRYIRKENPVARAMSLSGSVSLFPGDRVADASI